MLSQEQSLFYLRLAKQGDENANTELLNNNTCLLKSIVKRFLNKGVEYDDLYQLACLGFVKAVKNFDESFSVRFSTYAVPMIIGEIKRFMRDDGAIKVSRAVKSLANKIGRFNVEYKSEKGVEPSIEVIAEHFLVEKEDVVFAMDSLHYPLSLSDADSEDDSKKTLLDKLPGKDNNDDLIDKIMLKNYIDNLPPRDKKVIILRYFRDKTQSEIARELGVSQVQISRIENRIIEDMKKTI